MHSADKQQVILRFIGLLPYPAIIISVEKRQKVHAQLSTIHWVKTGHLVKQWPNGIELWIVGHRIPLIEHKSCIGMQLPHAAQTVGRDALALNHQDIIIILTCRSLNDAIIILIDVGSQQIAIEAYERFGEKIIARTLIEIMHLSPLGLEPIHYQTMEAEEVGGY